MEELRSAEPAPSTSMRRWAPRINYLFAAYPLLALGLIFYAWGAQWLSIGHAPRTCLDPPQNVVIGAVYTLALFSLGGALPMLVLNFMTCALSFECAVRSRAPVQRALGPILFPLVTWPPLLIVWKYHDVVGWLMD